MKSALPQVTCRARRRRPAPRRCRRARRCAASPAHVGDAARPAGRGAGRTPARRRRVRGLPGQQPAHEQPPAERERNDGARRIGGVGRDAARALADAFAASPLFGRQVLVVASAASSAQRIGDQALVAALGVEHPQAVDRVAAGELRRNTTRRPSGDTATLRGSPSVSRWVRAYWRGNVSVTPPL